MKLIIIMRNNIPYVLIPYNEKNLNATKTAYGDNYKIGIATELGIEYVSKES